MKIYTGELQQNPASTYEYIKTCLLCNAGLMKAQAETKWFSLNVDFLRGKSTGEVLQQMNRLLNRVYDNADNYQDRHARLILAIIRTFVDEDFRLHLDNSAIKTRHDLKTALEAWESSHGGFGKEEGHRHKCQSPLVCHKCHKPGHKAYQCQTASVEPSTSMPTSRPDTFVPKCYTCSSFGHKSPECPNKQKGPEESTQKEVQAKNKEKLHKTQAAVSLEDNEQFNMTTAVLFGQDLPIPLDTGAEMTVVPQEFIPPRAYTGLKVKLRSFEGSVREVETAHVCLAFEKGVWKGEAAMMNVKDIMGEDF